MCSGARWGRGSRFPEGRGRREPGGPPQNGCSGRACAAARAGRLVRVSRRGRAARAGGTGTRFSRRGRAARAGGPAGLCKRAQGTAVRRVAAVPVCPPFRDRSRGGREVGAAPPVVGGCCEAGLRRCGRRGAAVPGSYARGRRGAAARRVYARGRRGRRPGGWLPCRFARHFVTGRGVAVKRGLRRRPPGIAVSGAAPLWTAGRGGSGGGYAIGRRGRWPGGFMQEGAGARRPKVVVKREIAPTAAGWL